MGSPFSASVESWPSHGYWRENETRVKQYWYVSFCLMMSSVQDRLTGIALRESENLNWATTAFYYSAVHSGRLLCFVCTGDYPTGHKELARLLGPGTSAQVGNLPQAQRLSPFDWLGKFTRHVQTPQPIAQSPTTARPDREAIVNAIDRTIPESRRAFDRFAPLLTKFKNLRNDCNYEALLVAHEKQHHIWPEPGSEASIDQGVTEGFEQLAAAAELASKRAVDLATSCYLEHLQRAPCFGADRAKFHAAHARYVDGRLARCLRTKFRASRAALAALQPIVDRLTWANPQPAADLDSFLAPIMYDNFGAKQGLMKRWRDDIAELREAISS